MPEQRLPNAVEATIYFITAEALTNVAKYAGANGAEVRLGEERGRVRVEIRDDGIGGADPRARQRPARAARPRRRARRAPRGRLARRARHHRHRGAADGARREAGARRRRAGAAGLAAAGCDSGPPVTQTRTVGSGLHAAGGRRLARPRRAAAQPPRPGVRITAGEKAIDRIRTEVSRRHAADLDASRAGSRSAPTRSATSASASASRRCRACGSRARDGAAQRPVGEGVRAARRRLGRRDRPRPGRRPRGRGRRLGGHRPQRPRDPERATCARTARATSTCASARSLELVLEGSGDVTYRGRPTVSSRQEGSGDVAPGRRLAPSTTATRTAVRVVGVRA